ncbi:MAG: ATP-binding protein [Bacteroidota bacterium]
MSKIIPLFLMLLIPPFLKAQTNTGDSLKQLLENETQDTNRVMLLHQLARWYNFSKPDTTLLLDRQGVELARKINFKKGETACLRGIGNVFTTKGNYPVALATDLQALKISEEIHDESEIAKFITSISNIYFYQGDIKRSIDYASRAIGLAQKQKDSVQLESLFLDLGDTYEKIDQLDPALFYTGLAYPLTVRHGNTESIGIVLGNFGNIMRKLGKSDSAIMYYRSAIPYCAQTNNSDEFCEIYLGLADIFLRQNKTDSSLWYARLSYSISNAAGFTAKILLASNFLAAYYKSVNNVDSAYAYLSATIAAKDSLFSQQKSNQMQSITYEEDMRQQQIEEAKQQERARAKQNALTGGLVALLIVAFLLIRNNRQKRKANVLLQKQKDEIDHKAHELSVQKEKLQQSYNNIEQLGEIGRKITSSLSVEKIISTVYDNVNVLMDANVFGIGIYNETLRRIEFPATYENGQPLPFYSNEIDDGNRFAPICFKSGKEIIIGDLNKEYKEYVEQISTPHEGGQPLSLIFLPLMVKEKKLGVITVQSFQHHAYTDYHLFMLYNIAAYAGIALDNAESYEQLGKAMANLKRTQGQLIQSEKMASLGELTAGIAHEIQNPLNFVNNFSEINVELIAEMNSELANGNITGARSVAGNILENEHKIMIHGKRADAIVKGMLQHSRGSNGAKELTDINGLCDEYLRLSYHGLRARDKKFNSIMKADYDQRINPVNVVAQDIGRVLLNLYNNAFYAVHEKKKLSVNGYEPAVSVRTVKNDKHILVMVKDNGNGIPQKIIDKIFQPFFTTKPTGQGTGLGLSLSYEIVKAHGGDIKLKSKEGEESEFIIELPL